MEDNLSCALGQQSAPARPYRIQCAEIWGGIRNADQDVCSAGINASLYSSSSDGDKGGDIYYLSVCESDRITRIVVADVMGHGEAVSEMSQFIYNALKSHMNDPSGDRVLSEVNQLATSRGMSAMTTAAVIAFFSGENNLYFAYAGHHPVLVKRRQGGRWFEAAVKGAANARTSDWTDVPLALMADAVFTQESMPLDTGDRLFLYTDGLTEAPDRAGNPFGATRLTAVLEEHGGTPLSQLRTAVIENVREHTGGNLTHDDVTLLAIEVR